jgi:hypothetical protein
MEMGNGASADVAWHLIDPSSMLIRCGEWLAVLLEVVAHEGKSSRAGIPSRNSRRVWFKKGESIKIRFRFRVSGKLLAKEDVID